MRIRNTQCRSDANLATGLAAAIGIGGGGVENGGLWEGKTRVALQSTLHAAAIKPRGQA